MQFSCFTRYPSTFIRVHLIKLNCSRPSINQRERKMLLGNFQDMISKNILCLKFHVNRQKIKEITETQTCKKIENFNINQFIRISTRKEFKFSNKTMQKRNDAFLLNRFSRANHLLIRNRTFQITMKNCTINNQIIPNERLEKSQGHVGKHPHRTIERIKLIHHVVMNSSNQNPRKSRKILED